MECPNIDKRIKNGFNTPINYKDFGGVDYIFYEHRDARGNVSNVQFCKKVGRRKDIFHCLNESEWKECPHYKTWE